MEFAYPAAFALLVLALLPLLIRARGKPIVLPSLAGLEGVHPGWRVDAARFLPLLRVAAIALLVVALARPRAGQAESLVPAEGIDIALSLDISGSMSENFAPGVTRLEAARDVLREFIRGRPGDRIGVVVFQADALPLQSLTLDHDALDVAVANLDTNLLADGTALGLGLGGAISLLRESPAASRIAILLTDGRHNEEETLDPLDAANLASSSGVRVYTIGITEGRSGGLQPVDDVLLTEMAERTGGQYFEAGSPDDLAAVYDEISDLEKSTLQEERYTRYSEYAPWFLTPAVALLAFDVILRGTLFRRLSA